jgi:hypothetical protein
MVWIGGIGDVDAVELDDDDIPSLIPQEALPVPRRPKAVDGSLRQAADRGRAPVLLDRQPAGIQ